MLQPLHLAHMLQCMEEWRRKKREMNADTFHTFQHPKNPLSKNLPRRVMTNIRHFGHISCNFPIVNHFIERHMTNIGHLTVLPSFYIAEHAKQCLLKHIADSLPHFVNLRLFGTNLSLPRQDRNNRNRVGMKGKG